MLFFFVNFVNWIVWFKYEWMNKRKANISGNCSVWEFIELNMPKHHPIHDLFIHKVNICNQNSFRMLINIIVMNYEKKTKKMRNIAFKLSKAVVQHITYILLPSKCSDIKFWDTTKMMPIFLSKMELIESIERYYYSITSGPLQKKNPTESTKLNHAQCTHLQTEMKTINTYDADYVYVYIDMCACIMNGSNNSKSIEQFWKIILPLSHFLWCIIKTGLFYDFLLQIGSVKLYFVY